MDKVAELRLDVQELESLLEKCTRQKVKDSISIEIRKLITEIVKLEQKQNEVASGTTTAVPAKPRKCYQVRLNNYAWDQNNKAVKFYVTLKNVQNLAAENVSCNFTAKTLEMNVRGLDGKDYVLTINNLLKPIDPAASTWKVKTDMVIVNAVKMETHTWSHVTEVEKRSSESKRLMPETEKGADPNDGLMTMMKNMYDQGDDEMKRTIAKAWTESQNKQPPMF